MSNFKNLPQLSHEVKMEYPLYAGNGMLESDIERILVFLNKAREFLCFTCFHFVCNTYYVMMIDIM